jgi:hypothetical protein
MEPATVQDRRGAGSAIGLAVIRPLTALSAVAPPADVRSTGGWESRWYCGDPKIGTTRCSSLTAQKTVSIGTNRAVGTYRSRLCQCDYFADYGSVRRLGVRIPSGAPYRQGHDQRKRWLRPCLFPPCVAIFHMGPWCSGGAPMSPCCVGGAMSGPVLIGAFTCFAVRILLMVVVGRVSSAVYLGRLFGSSPWRCCLSG